jgi:hypothetical protein
MALDVTGKTFTRVRNEFRAEPGNSGQHVRGVVTKNGAQLYTHNRLKPNGSGDAALRSRLTKRAAGAQLVKQTMVTEYGGDLAKAVFAKVKAEVKEMGRNLDRGVTRGDLDRLHAELQLQEPQYRKLEELKKNLEMLRDRVPNDTTEMIKDELTGSWTSAAKEQFDPIQRRGGATEVEPSSRDGVKEGYYPVRWPGDAEVVGLRPTMYAFKEGPGVAEVVGPRPMYGVREEYFSVQWPGNGADGAEVGFRHTLYLDYLLHGSMQFDDKTGALTVARQGHSMEDNREENMAALTGFIRRHFQVAPGQPAFQNIANNILSYLPRGRSLGEAASTAQAVVGDTARSSRTASSRTFTMSVTEDGNVGVEGYIGIPYRNSDGDPVRPVDYSKYRFVRKDSFEISGEHLRVDPTAFDAKANLVSVSRSDAIEWAR